MKKIIIVTGMPLAGKSTFCETLKSRGFPVITMSHVVKEEMKNNGIEINSRSLREYPTNLRKKYGMDIVAKKCKPLIDRAISKSNLIVIDGSRASEEIEFFRTQYEGSIKIIAVIASQKARFDRFRNRNREDDEKEWEEFIFRDDKELKWGVGSAIARADYELINEGPIKELRKKSEKLVEEILKGS